MASQILIIHERLSVWARHVRPRFADRPVRIVETRSSDDLVNTLATTSFPMVLLDLGRRHRAGLEELDLIHRLAPDALSLVLDPEELEGVPLLARELGATHVISGATIPPVVLRLLSRWLPISRKRQEHAGWLGSTPEPAEPEPWNWLAPYLDAKPVAS